MIGKYNLTKQVNGFKVTHLSSINHQSNCFRLNATINCYYRNYFDNTHPVGVMLSQTTESH